MAKLFALEVQESDPLDKRNQLLIDKVLEYDKKTKSNTSVTAELIKQRHDLRKEITKQLNENKQEEEEENDGDSQDSSASDEGGEQNDDDSTSGGDSSEASTSSDDSDEDESSSSSSDNDDKDSGSSSSGNADKDSGDSEESAAADDVESLRKMTNGGGGGKGKEEGDGAATEAFKPAARKKSVPAGELCVVGVQTALRNLFAPLKQSHQKRMLAIEDFQLSDKPKATDQPLVYVKEEVIESLNRLISLSNRYITKNTTTVEQGVEGLKKLGEQLTVYRQFVEGGRFHFSQQLIQSEDLMKYLSLKGKNELAYTSAVLNNYLERSSALAVKLMQNPFDQIAGALQSAGYKEEAGVFICQTALPGFSQMQASVVPFSNYIDTKYEEYQIYKVQTYKPQDLYSLPAISLEEDKDLKKLLAESDKILMSAGMTLDNMNDLSTHYQQFIDGLKTTSYDVEKGAQTNLAGLGLDEKLKDFIKFKLVSELYVNDLDTAVQYLSASLSALAQLVELSDK